MSKKSTLFARLSLDYADHPKIISLSDAAFRAHITFILYCRKYETDGIIKNRVANRLALQWDSDVLHELQNNDPEHPSLVQLDNGDYELTGYADMQETKAEIEARRERNRRNGAKGGRGNKAGAKRTASQSQTKNKTESLSKSQSQSQTEPGGQNKAETETETETEVNTLSSHVASDDDGKSDADTGPEFSDDVHRLAQYLAEWIVRNGNRKPTVGKTWLQAIDRLIRIDGYAPDQIRQVIDWCQQDEFWQGNILSAAKLRKQFDQLKNRMFQQRNRQPHNGMAPGSARALNTLQLGQQLQASYEQQQKEIH
jgi:hypothetical protein